MSPQRALGTPSIQLAGRPARLRAWVAFQIVLATLAFVVVAAGTRLRPEIALETSLVPRDLALPAGMAFWLVFGLVGGVRARLRPGGAVLTFSMPFIVAGTILGGPLAGALMGLISELEVREIRTQPWYGTLANHAVAVLAAIGAAVLGGQTQVTLQALFPGHEAPVFFVVAMVTALVFATINVLLVIPTLALRQDVSLGEAARAPDAGFRATAVAEAILAWNMAASYLLLGWWAPMACAALVLIVWQAHDEREARKRDDRTGLLNDAGFRPRLEAAIAAAQAGRRSAVLLLVDLDDFWQVNEMYGLEGGDEVLIVTARRLLTSVRAMDSVSRTNRAGDEFAILLDGVPDLETAERLARRLQDRIREPIRLRTTASGAAQVDASIGVLPIELGTSLSPDEALAEVGRREAHAKDLGSGIVSETVERGGAVARRVAAKRALRAGLRRTPDGADPAVVSDPNSAVR